MKSMACLKVKDSPRGERGSGLTWMEWLGGSVFPAPVSVVRTGGGDRTKTMYPVP